MDAANFNSIVTTKKYVPASPSVATELFRMHKWIADWRAKGGSQFHVDRSGDGFTITVVMHGYLRVEAGVFIAQLEQGDLTSYISKLPNSEEAFRAYERYKLLLKGCDGLVPGGEPKEYFAVAISQGINWQSFFKYLLEETTKGSADQPFTLVYAPGE